MTDPAKTPWQTFKDKLAGIDKVQAAVGTVLGAVGILAVVELVKPEKKKK